MLGALALGLASGCEGRSEASAVSKSAVAAPHASAAPAPAATPAPAPAAAPAASPCDTLCSRATELKCRAASACPAACREMYNQPTCQAEMRAALACFVSHPVTDWECDEDGMAAIKNGICDAEQGNVVSCIGKAH